MPSVCFYFQVHQPYRIRRFSFFESSSRHEYFDEGYNRHIIEKVTEKCYLPANTMMLQLINRYDGRFRVAYSITGVLVEQLKKYSPKTLESFVKLAETGCVEFMGETYYHTLASVYDEDEFKEQVQQHAEVMRELLGASPNVLRNTELVYDDRFGQLATEMGYRIVLAEGADDVLDWRSPNFVYSVPGTDTAILLKNYRLSDDVSFRFSNQDWPGWPLTADKYAAWIHSFSGSGDVVNLFMDYETFGEHQWNSTGIFEFLEHLPDAVFLHPDWDFCTPSEVVERYMSVGELSYPRVTSWADTGRDLNAWMGNSMQSSSLEDVYRLNANVRATGNPEIIDTWRKLQTSDHFYYMCTAKSEDGKVHAYFSPFESPYDGFVNFRNVFRDFERTVSEMRVDIQQKGDVVPRAVTQATVERARVAEEQSKEMPKAAVTARTADAVRKTEEAVRSV